MDARNKSNWLLNALQFSAPIVAVAAVVWQAGAMGKELATNSSRISILETHGGEALMVHQAKEEFVNKDVADKLGKMEKAIDTLVSVQLTIQRIEGRFDTLESKVDALKSALEDHKRNEVTKTK